MTTHVLRSFPIGLLRTTISKASIPVQRQIFHPNLQCKALSSRYRNPPRPSNPRLNDPVSLEAEEEKKSEWLKHNDRVFPPQLPNEEPRPAFVCHELINVKYSPKKMWVVACFVRGMSVDEALKQLASARRRGAAIVTKAIEEAVEMAVKDHNVEFRSNLWIAESFCHPGLIVKGIRRRGRGIISAIRYRYSNYYIRLEEGQPPADYYCKEAKWTGPQMFEDWMKEIRQRRISHSL